MEKIKISATNHSPEVVFSTNGNFSIEGRSFPENASEFYDPLIHFAAGLYDTKHVSFDINLEYINTASTKKILNLIRQLDENDDIESIVVNWHYEEGDDDSIETAEIFEESTSRVKFTYNEFAEIA